MYERMSLHNIVHAQSVTKKSFVFLKKRNTPASMKAASSICNNRPAGAGPGSVSSLVKSGAGSTAPGQDQCSCQGSSMPEYSSDTLHNHHACGAVQKNGPAVRPAAKGDDGWDVAVHESTDGPASDGVNKESSPTEPSPPSSSMPTNDSLNSDLAELFASVDSLPDPSVSRKKRLTHLPGFLFHDGKDKPLNDEDEVSSATTGTGASVSEFGSASEECVRLTSKVFTNSYEVLRLAPHASEEAAKRAFRKISLLIHPDKCRHPRAQEAFLVVNKAYEDLQKPEMKEKYKMVYQEAEKRVVRNLVKENKLRAKRKEPLLSTEGPAIQDLVSEMCETLLTEFTEAQEYAEKCRKANEAYEKEAEETQLKEERQELERKKKWEETMDTRVGDWRDFKEGVATKRVKVAAFVPVTHRREQRKPGDKSVPSKPKGIDESYKQNWR